MEIANIFTNKYRTLYNSVGYNKHNMDLLRKEIDAQITDRCGSNTNMQDYYHTITVKEIKNAVDMLKGNVYFGSFMAK